MPDLDDGVGYGDGLGGGGCLPQGQASVPLVAGRAGRDGDLAIELRASAPGATRMAVSRGVFRLRHIRKFSQLTFKVASHLDRIRPFTHTVRH